MSATMQVELIEETERFRALRDEWNALLRRSPADGLFLTWEWLFSWWTHLSGRARLHLLTVRSGGELVAIAPFLLRPRRAPEAPFPVLEFMGTRSAGSDYLDLIVRRGSEPESLAALADHLGRAKIPLRLTQFDGGASTAASLGAALGRQGWRSIASDGDLCPVVRWPERSWPAYLATRDRKHRSNFTRGLRQLTGRFALSVDLARSDDERREAFDALLALHDRRWRDRGGTTAFHTPALRAFHDAFTRLALARGWLRLFVLRLDGAPASVLYALRYGGTVYDYQKGFDPEYRRYSVGTVTTGLAIQRAIEEGADEYDFLHGAEWYKLQWADHARHLGRLELFAPGSRGAVYRWLVIGSTGARGAARRLVGDTLAERLTGLRG